MESFKLKAPFTQELVDLEIERLVVQTEYKRLNEEIRGLLPKPSDRQLLRYLALARLQE